MSLFVFLFPLAWMRDLEGNLLSISPVGGLYHDDPVIYSVENWKASSYPIHIPFFPNLLVG